jgi:osmotically-inducible protein OsmY
MTQRERRILIATLLVTVGVASGCHRTEEGELALDPKVERDLEAAGEEVKKGARAAGEAVREGAERLEARLEPVLDDAAITAKVKAKLAADPEVNALGIDVDTSDGVVTLTGRTASEALRLEAEKLARGTAGVRDVRNHLEIVRG